MSIRSLCALGLLLLAPSCTTTLAVRSTQPGPVSVGPTDHLLLFDGHGRRSAREFLAQELVRQCRVRSYFRVTDRSEEGVGVRLAGRRVILDGGLPELASNEAGLRLDVLEWNHQRGVADETRTDAEGKSIVVQVPVQSGNVLLALTLFDANGRAILAESEYEGAYTTSDLQVPRDDVIEQAGRDALTRFLADVTPVVVVHNVRLDDSDDGQEKILDAARAGALAQALSELRRYQEDNPFIPSAAYNLGVLQEATGDFHSALASYDLALSLGGQDYYPAARTACARRLAAQEILREDP